VTAREGVVVGMRCMPGNPYDGHTAAEQNMKNDGLLRRNWLKGSLGDAMHAVLCGAGHDLRLILAHLRALYCAFFVCLRPTHLAALIPSGNDAVQLANSWTACKTNTAASDGATAES
jgi:hypothetical protein